MIPPELVIIVVVGVAAGFVWVKTGSGLSRIVCLACLGLVFLLLIVAAVIR